MKKIFELLKSEFERTLSQIKGSGIGEKNKIDKEINQQILAIRQRYPDEKQARKQIEQQWENVYFEVNAARKINENIYLRWAMLNYYWGIYEWARGCRLEGIKFMVEATRAQGLWQGYLEGLERFELIESLRQQRKVSGSEGGLERAGRYQPVKEELLRLLRSEAPREGWPTKRKAVDAIEGKLWRFIDGPYRNAFKKESIQRHKDTGRERKPFSMIKENLDRTILDWSRNDKTIKAAFFQAIRKRHK